MENHIVSLLLHGCSLARDLESNLPNLGNRPDLVSNSCEQILGVFNAALEQIVNPSDPPRQVQMNAADFVQQNPTVHHHHQQLPVQYYGPAPADAGGAQALPQTSLFGGGAGAAEAGGSAMVGQVGAAEGSDPGGRASSSASAPRSRRRQDDPTRRTVEVEAPRFGNLEIPPEDGFTWKKYGQKEILGSRFPRSYYRCTHQKLYDCPAKKLVQRLDSNPNIFQVTYRGAHTCHMSSTAPSIPPPLLPLPPPPLPTLPQASSAAQLPAGMPQWLPMDFGLGTAGPSAAASTTRDDSFVVDMVDAMFNSGSSSTNSMDVIFSSVDRRDDQRGPSWDAGDNKD